MIRKGTKSRKVEEVQTSMEPFAFPAPRPPPTTSGRSSRARPPPHINIDNNMNINVSVITKPVHTPEERVQPIALQSSPPPATPSSSSSAATTTTRRTVTRASNDGTARCPECGSMLAYANHVVEFETHVFECRLKNGTDPMLPLVTYYPRAPTTATPQQRQRQQRSAGPIETRWAPLPTLSSADHRSNPTKVEHMANVFTTTLGRMTRVRQKKHRSQQAHYTHTTSSTLYKLVIPPVEHEEPCERVERTLTPRRDGCPSTTCDVGLSTEPPDAGFLATLNSRDEELRAVVESNQKICAKLAQQFRCATRYEVTPHEVHPERVCLLAHFLKHHPALIEVDLSAVQFDAETMLRSYEAVKSAVLHNDQIRRLVLNPADALQAALQRQVDARREHSDRSVNVRRRYNDLVIGYAAWRRARYEAVSKLEGDEVSERTSITRAEGLAWREMMIACRKTFMRLDKKHKAEVTRQRHRAQQQIVVDAAAESMVELLLRFYGHLMYMSMAQEAKIRVVIEAEEVQARDRVRLLRRLDRREKQSVESIRKKGEMKERAMVFAQAEQTVDVLLEGYGSLLEDLQRSHRELLAWLHARQDELFSFCEHEEHVRAYTTNEQAAVFQQLCERFAQERDWIVMEQRRARERILQGEHAAREQLEADAVNYCEMQRSVFKAEDEFLSLQMHLTDAERKRRECLAVGPDITFTNQLPAEQTMRPNAVRCELRDCDDNSEPVNVLHNVDISVNMSDGWLQEFTNASLISQQAQSKEMKALDACRSTVRAFSAQLSDISKRHGVATMASVAPLCHVDSLPPSTIGMMKRRILSATIDVHINDDASVLSSHERLFLNTDLDFDDGIAPEPRSDAAAQQRSLKVRVVPPSSSKSVTDEQLIHVLKALKYHCTARDIRRSFLREVSITLSTEHHRQDHYRTSTPQAYTSQFVTTTVVAHVMVYPPFLVRVSSALSVAVPASSTPTPEAPKSYDVREYHEGMGPDTLSLFPPDANVLAPALVSRDLGSSRVQSPQFTVTNSNAQESGSFHGGYLTVSCTSGWGTYDQLLFKEESPFKLELNKRGTVERISMSGMPFAVVERGVLQPVKQPGDSLLAQPEVVCKIVASKGMASSETVRMFLQKFRFANLAVDVREGDRVFAVALTDSVGLDAHIDFTICVQIVDDATEVEIPHTKLTYFNSNECIPPSIAAASHNVHLPLARDATVSDVDTEFFYGGYLTVEITNPMPGDSVALLARMEIWEVISRALAAGTATASDTGATLLGGTHLEIENGFFRLDGSRVSNDDGGEDNVYIVCGGRTIGILHEGLVLDEDRAFTTKETKTRLRVEFLSMTIQLAQALLRLLTFYTTHHGQSKTSTRNVTLMLGVGNTVYEPDTVPDDVRIDNKFDYNITVRVAECLNFINERGCCVEYKESNGSLMRLAPFEVNIDRLLGAISFNGGFILAEIDEPNDTDVLWLKEDSEYVIAERGADDLTQRRSSGTTIPRRGSLRGITSSNSFRAASTARESSPQGVASQHINVPDALNLSWTGPTSSRSSRSRTLVSVETIDFPSGVQAPVALGYTRTWTLTVGRDVVATIMRSDLDTALYVSFVPGPSPEVTKKHVSMVLRNIAFGTSCASEGTRAVRVHLAGSVRPSVSTALVQVNVKGQTDRPEISLKHNKLRFMQKPDATVLIPLMPFGNAKIAMPSGASAELAATMCCRGSVLTIQAVGGHTKGDNLDILSPEEQDRMVEDDTVLFNPFMDVAAKGLGCLVCEEGELRFIGTSDIIATISRVVEKDGTCTELRITFSSELDSADLPLCVASYVLNCIGFSNSCERLRGVTSRTYQVRFVGAPAASGKPQSSTARTKLVVEVTPPLLVLNAISPRGYLDQYHGRISWANCVQIETSERHARYPNRQIAVLGVNGDASYVFTSGQCEVSVVNATGSFFDVALEVPPWETFGLRVDTHVPKPKSPKTPDARQQQRQASQQSLLGVESNSAQQLQPDTTKKDLLLDRTFLCTVQQSPTRLTLSFNASSKMGAKQLQAILRGVYVRVSAGSVAASHVTKGLVGACTVQWHLMLPGGVSTLVSTHVTAASERTK